MAKMNYYCLLTLVSFGCYIDASGIYQKLVDNLFKSYNPGLRPVIEPSTTTMVKIYFGIIQLLDVEEVSKTIKCITFMEMIWKDEFLRWNENEFENTSYFRYPHYLVWKPDIILTNTPDLNEGPAYNKASSNVIISSEGKIKNPYTAVYTATCRDMDMLNFPFDQHTCNLDFASWTYAGKEVDLFDDSVSYSVPMSMKLVTNSEWDVSITSSEKYVEMECCPNETYPTLRFTVSLKRKPLYFLINVIIPITITCCVSFIGMFSPSNNTGERTEKAFLGITTLLAVSLLMFSVSSQLPVTSNGIPLMGFFLGVYIIAIALAIIAAAIIMHIDTAGLQGQPLPKWVKQLFLLRIGKWLQVNIVLDKASKNELTEMNHQQDNPDNKSNIHAKPLISQLEQLLAKVETLLMMSSSKIQNRELHLNVRNEWSMLSTVLDRLCMIVFLSFSAVFTITLFWSNK